jgi:SAM-dependent methyltransferase
VDELVFDRIHAIEDRHWWFRGRRAVIRALLSRDDLPRDARILDAGCGTGRNLEEYARLGQAEGVEPSAMAVDFCRRRGLTSVRQGTLESLPYEDGTFDLIVTSDVLEHVRDDGLGLTEMHRVAKPDARLVLTVPAYQWLWSRHDDSHHHFRRYTKRRLAEVAAANGWTPILATYFNSLLLAPIACVRLFQRIRPPEDETTDYERTPGMLNRVLELPMRLEAALVARGVRLPAGVSVGMVCRPADAQGPTFRRRTVSQRSRASNPDTTGISGDLPST